MNGYRSLFVLVIITLFSLVLVSCSKEEKEGDNNVELIESIISERSPVAILDVENFTNIYECLKFRTSIEGSVVIILSVDYIISSALLLPENTTFIINDCTIKQADFTFDNVFRSSNVVLDNSNPYYLPEKIDTLRNISIIGVGNAIIQGPDNNLTDPNNHDSPMVTADVYGARTHTISLCFVDGGEIRGLTFTRPRGWAICFEYCSNYSVHDNYFESTNMDSPYNYHATGDGIDLRRGCHHFNIFNINGSTTDDLIALNTCPVAEITPNRYYAAYSMKLTKQLEEQNPRVSDIHDVQINNIVKNGINRRGSGALIRLNCEGDKELFNIYISQGVYSGYVTEGNRQAIYFSHFSGPYTPNSIHDVYISEIKIKKTSRTIDNVIDARIKLKNVLATHLYNESGGGIFYYSYNEGLVVTD